VEEGARRGAFRRARLRAIVDRRRARAAAADARPLHTDRPKLTLEDRAALLAAMRTASGR
jgi:hypothetical protein